MVDPNIDPGIAVRFTLAIDFIDLGTWTKCEGLGVTLNTDQRTEGGAGDFVTQLPGRFQYSPIILTRPVGPATAGVLSWLQKTVMQVVPNTAEIVMMNSWNEPIYNWSIMGVTPSRWSGPNLDAENSAVALEQLELVHQGFL